MEKILEEIIIDSIVGKEPLKEVSPDALLEWVKRVRERFDLPSPPRKIDDEWWEGYNEALKDVERFAVLLQKQTV